MTSDDIASRKTFNCIMISHIDSETFDFSNIVFGIFALDYAYHRTNDVDGCRIILTNHIDLLLDFLEIFISDN